ncbi:MAG: DUF99 family protein [Thermoplasmata archaeon]|nr:DUF99 family protein [Thermoplasmata archaeon]
MRRALAKEHLRVLGVDDGPFTRRHRYAPIAVVAMSLPGSIEAVLSGRVRVDGRDATERILELLRSSPYLEGSRAVLLDGISVGGFNLIDLDRLHRALGRPVVAVTRRPPDFPSIRAALARYFASDFRRRWRLVRAHRPFALGSDGLPLWLTSVGAKRQEARVLVRRSIVVGYWPEPLRLARLVARSLRQGALSGPRARGSARRARPSIRARTSSRGSRSP